MHLGSLFCGRVWGECAAEWSIFNLELGASSFKSPSHLHVLFLLQKAAPKKKKAAPKKKTATKKVRWRHEYIMKRRLHPCYAGLIIYFHSILTLCPFASDDCFDNPTPTEDHHQEEEDRRQEEISTEFTYTRA